jgi:hypothetical protein
MNRSTAAGTKVRNIMTGKVWTVYQDLGSTKLIESARGTLARITPEYYCNWIEVLPQAESFASSHQAQAEPRLVH